MSLYQNDSLGKPSSKFTLPRSIGKRERRPTLLSYAGALRARGKDSEEIYAELLHVNRERCDPPLSTVRELNDLRRIAKWAAGKPVGTMRSGIENDGDRIRLKEAQHVVAGYPWSGTFARTCRHVAAFVLSQMARHCKLTIDLDTRTIADETGYSRETTARALRALSGRYRLPKAKIPVLFAYQKPSSRSDASSYTLSEKLRKIAHTVLSHTPSVDVCLKMRSFVHDTFRGKKGLSKTCLVVLEAIERERCRTAVDVSVLSNVKVRTVERCLSQLKSEGLVEKKEKYLARTEVSLDVVARRRGTKGHGGRQRAEHERERESWKEYLSDPLRGRKLKVVRVGRVYDNVPGVVFFDNETSVDNSRGFLDDAREFTVDNKLIDNIV